VERLRRDYIAALAPVLKTLSTHRRCSSPQFTVPDTPESVQQQLPKIPNVVSQEACEGFNQVRLVARELVPMRARGKRTSEVMVQARVKRSKKLLDLSGAGKAEAQLKILSGLGTPREVLKKGRSLALRRLFEITEVDFFLACQWGMNVETFPADPGRQESMSQTRVMSQPCKKLLIFVLSCDVPRFFRLDVNDGMTPRLQ
jgi:hypothetical protein